MAGFFLNIVEGEQEAKERQASAGDAPRGNCQHWGIVRELPRAAEWHKRTVVGSLGCPLLDTPRGPSHLARAVAKKMGLRMLKEIGRPTRPWIS